MEETLRTFQYQGQSREPASAGADLSIQGICSAVTTNSRKHDPTREIAIIRLASVFSRSTDFVAAVREFPRPEAESAAGGWRIRTASWPLTAPCCALPTLALLRSAQRGFRSSCSSTGAASGVQRQSRLSGTSTATCSPRWRLEGVFLRRSAHATLQLPERSATRT